MVKNLPFDLKGGMYKCTFLILLISPLVPNLVPASLL